MPSYKYHCIFCNVDETIDKKMSQYKSEEPCQICGKIMKRKVEDLVSNYQDTHGFYGKKS